MIEWRAVIAVAIGAAIGGVLRYVVGQLFLQRFGPGFPYGTLFINVSGSVCIGIVAELGLTRALGMTPLLRVLLATGVLGGYTTFSTFSLDAVTLLGEGLLPAFIYTGASVLLGFAGAAAGVVLVRLAAR
ncbi:MAG TPA: fluoride efflux transporter CrcB [Verrucomicrobiae bacterium]|nr:fluoride efflux transporter CrcB [Verrucomicrobiae bacterium]